MKRDVDDVEKLVKQLTRFDVFKARTTFAIGVDGENDNEATCIETMFKSASVHFQCSL